MANTYPTGFQGDNPDAPAAAADRGLFDCFGKKEEKEDVPMTDAGHKLHRSNSSSSSSSEEEVEEGGVKIRRRKKKGLTDKIKEKLPGHKKEGANAAVAEGNYNHPCAAAANEEEKKGVFEKLKEKLPGNHKDEPVIDRHPTPAPGILNKIKEKLPGHHKDEAEIAPHPTPATAPAHTYAAAPASAYSEAPPPTYSAAPAPAYSAAQAPASDHCQLGGHCGDIHAAHEQPEKKGIVEMIKEKLPGGHKDGEVKKDH